LPIVNYTTLLAGNAGGNFPINENFTAAGDVAAVPEPNVSLLLGLGVLGMVIVRRYQHRTVAVASESI